MEMCIWILVNIFSEYIIRVVEGVMYDVRDNKTTMFISEKFETNTNIYIRKLHDVWVSLHFSFTSKFHCTSTQLRFGSQETDILLP